MSNKPGKLTQYVIWDGKKVLYKGLNQWKWVSLKTSLLLAVCFYTTRATAEKSLKSYSKTLSPISKELARIDNRTITVKAVNIEIESGVIDLR